MFCQVAFSWKATWCFWFTQKMRVTADGLYTAVPVECLFCLPSTCINLQKNPDVATKFKKPSSD